MSSSTITLEDIYAPIETKLQAVPNAILDILSTPNELAHEVIRYFFSSQGKLLRPAMTLLGAEVKGVSSEQEEKLISLAASFEIFHAATLIHDDIIDSSYLRRNIPTINVKWSSQVAVLVGDYLHDKAIGAIFATENQKVTAGFLQTAGAVCDGEIHELKEKNNFNLSEDEYLEIIDKKTAALLACSVQAGGMFVGATPEEAEALKRFGRYFGIAFQIVDDCLDFTGNEEEFGKTLGADCVGGVLTLPLIRLIQLVDEKKKNEVFKIFKSEVGNQRYEVLLNMIREYETIEYSLKRAAEFNEKARLELSIFDESPAKQSLYRLLDYVTQRNR